MENKNQEKIDKHEKEFAALSYFWCFSLLVYFSPEAKSKFVKHHAKQGVFLFFLSIIFYLLPYLDFLNYFLVFLMALGVVEASLGNWSFVPLFGSYLKNDYKPERHFAFIKFWWKKLKDAFHNLHYERKKSVFIKQLKKNKEVDFNTCFKKQERSLWNEKITLIEDLFTTFAKDRSCKTQKQKFFTEVRNKKSEKIAYFGAVDKNSFKVAYIEDKVLLPAPQKSGIYAIKTFSAKDINKVSFQELLQLIFV